MAREPKDYTKLKALLEAQETFPLDFIHKFIGRNSPAFAAGVAELERRHPELKLQHSRMSQGDAHVALTYTFRAESADAILVVLRATDEIADLIYVL
jgi:putative lipoic acid-binding regulatory protein